MSPITCIIVDDEPLALDLIEGYVSRTPFLALKARCSNAYEAIEAITAHKVDLIFLDIQMPGMNGVSLSRTITGDKRIIFTTAFEQYAMEGYKVDALDFLLKPFSYEEFLKAANKAKSWFELLRKSSDSVSAPQEHIFVRSEFRQIKVRLRDILYIEGLKDYVRFHLAEGDPVMSLMSLKSLEEDILPPARFMRIHRSYIISLDRIDYVERNQVVIGDMRITIGEPFSDAFRQYLAGQ
jgi:DNA-binding LytR/AlgR family response regulator